MVEIEQYMGEHPESFRAERSRSKTVAAVAVGPLLLVVGVVFAVIASTLIPELMDNPGMASSGSRRGGAGRAVLGLALIVVLGFAFGIALLLWARKKAFTWFSRDTGAKLSGGDRASFRARKLYEQFVTELQSGSIKGIPRGGDAWISGATHIAAMEDQANRRIFVYVAAKDGRSETFWFDGAMYERLRAR